LYFLELDLPELAEKELLEVENTQVRHAPFLKKLVDLYLEHGLFYRANRASCKLWELLGINETQRGALNLLRPLYPLLYNESISLMCKKYKNVDPLLVFSVIRKESNFNPRVVSPAKAIGLMQIMPSTGKLLAQELKIPDFSVQQLYDPYRSIQLGVYFLSSQLGKYGNRREFTLAVYNGGERSISRAMDIHADRDMDVFVEEIEFRETRNYVKTVLRNYWMYYELWKDMCKVPGIKGE
jgi:soluble lytic murein transglycosylase